MLTIDQTLTIQNDFPEIYAESGQEMGLNDLMAMLRLEDDTPLNVDTLQFCGSKSKSNVDASLVRNIIDHSFQLQPSASSLTRFRSECSAFESEDDVNRVVAQGRFPFRNILVVRGVDDELSLVMVHHDSPSDRDLDEAED